MFFKGALLEDPEKLFRRIGKHMQARQLRFSTVSEVMRLKPTIKAYIEETIGFERYAAKVPLKKAAELVIPEELPTKLNTSPALKKAFVALTPGPQKGRYLPNVGCQTILYTGVPSR